MVWEHPRHGGRAQGGVGGTGKCWGQQGHRDPLHPASCTRLGLAEGWRGDARDRQRGQGEGHIWRWCWDLGYSGSSPPLTAALGRQSRCCGFMLPAAAGAWQVDEKTTALMFPSAGNAAMGGKEGVGGVEGKEGLEREKEGGEGKGGTGCACSTPCPCTGSMEPPRPWDEDTEEGPHHPGGT